MLVVGRKVNEAVVIDRGDRSVRIVVLELDRGKVRLGFDADTDVPIHREEVLERMRKEENGGQPPTS